MRYILKCFRSAVALSIVFLLMFDTAVASGAAPLYGPGTQLQIGSSFCYESSPTLFRKGLSKFTAKYIVGSVENIGDINLCFTLNPHPGHEVKARFDRKSGNPGSWIVPFEVTETATGNTWQYSVRIDGNDEIEVFDPLSPKQDSPEYVERRIAELKAIANDPDIEPHKRREAVSEIRYLWSLGKIERSFDYGGRIDLHLHTIHSDGQFTPEYLVTEYWLKGFSAISITDHNTFDGVVEALKSAEILGMRIIPGVEISVFTDKVAAGKMHLLAYWTGGTAAFLEWLSDPSGKEVLLKINMEQNISKKRMVLIKEKFNNENPGLKVDDTDIKKLFPFDMAKRTDLARVIFSKYGPGGKNILASGVKDIHKCKNRYLKKIKVETLETPSVPGLDETMVFLAGAGFISGPAHPLVRKKWDIPQLERIFNIFSEIHIDGQVFPGFGLMEIWHPSASPVMIKKLSGLLEKLNANEYKNSPLLVTSGSDTHGDFEKLYGMNCPTESVAGRRAFDASFRYALRYFEKKDKARYFGDILMKWAGLDPFEKLRWDISPVWSVDDDKLGKKESHGRIITVTPAVLETLKDYEKNVNSRRRIKRVLRLLLLGKDVSAQDRAGIEAFLGRYPAEDTRENTRNTFYDGTNEGKGAYESDLEDLSDIIVCDNSLHGDDGFNSEDIISILRRQTGPCTRLSFGERDVKRVLAKASRRKLIKFSGRDTGKGLVTYVLRGKIGHNESLHKDLTALSAYFEELASIKTDIRIFVSKRMQGGLSETETQSGIRELEDRVESFISSYSSVRMGQEAAEQLVPFVTAKLARVIELLDSKNEPAASWCLDGIGNAVHRVKENILREKFRAASSFLPKIRPEKGRAVVYKASAGKDVTFENMWAYFRSMHSTVTFELEEKRNMEKALDDISGILEKINTISGRPEDKEGLGRIIEDIEKLAESIDSRDAELKSDEKRLSVVYARGASEILRFGSRHIKTAAILLSEAGKHIELRKKEAVRIIDHVVGIRNSEARKQLFLESEVPLSRTDSFFRELNYRDASAARGFRRVAGFVRSGKINEAIEALKDAKKDKGIMGEPEYANMEKDIDSAIDRLRTGDRKEAFAEITMMRKRCETLRIVHRMAKEYLKRLVDAEITLPKETDRTKIMEDVFNDNIAAAGTDLSSKGMRVFKVKLHQLIYISHSPRKTGGGKAVDPVFEGISAFIYICRKQKASSVLAGDLIQENGFKRVECLLEAIKKRDDRIRNADMDGIGEAIIEDMLIRGKDKEVFRECAQIDIPRTGPITGKVAISGGILNSSAEGPRDIRHPEGLSRSAMEIILSAGINSGVTLAFEENIGGGLAENVLEVVLEIQKLKTEKSKYAKILKNVRVKKFRCGTAAKQLKKDINGSGKVIVFARARDRKHISNLEKKVSMVYLDDENFPENAYYPLLEAVVIALSEYVPGGSKAGFSGFLSELNISSLEKREGYLLFKLLPGARQFPRDELILKYDELRRMLSAA